MIFELISLANKLDQQGLYEEANQLDALIKIAVDMSPQEYEKYYGKPMDKERLELWKAEQKEPEDIVDLFQGPDKEKLEERLDKLVPWRPQSSEGKKSLVSVLSELRQIAAHTKMKSMGVVLNPNSVMVKLKAPNELELATFLDEMDFIFTGKLSNLPIQHFAHVISDGVAAVYGRTNRNAMKTLQSYPGADVVIGFAHWNQLKNDEQREFKEVIDKLFVEKI